MGTQRLFDFDGTFFKGANSSMEPSVIPMGSYWMATNAMNLGGVLSCRPGNRCVAKLPEGRLQGATLFRPKEGVEQIVVCVDGVLYASDWPFIDYKQIPNIRLSPDAAQVYWELTEQTARRISDDLTSAIELIDPRTVLFINDGSLSACAWYDGSNSGQIRNQPFGTPSGGAMKWIGDRLWVAKGRFLFASDIGNPFSFRELIYLGGVGAFVFNEVLTALTTTPGLEAPQLLAFTTKACSLIQANIRNRDLWASTPDFIREIFDVGATGQRGIVNHFGNLFWFSQSGFCKFDTAVQTRVKAHLPIRDNELYVSKSELHEDLSLVAGGAFSQFVVMSVPANSLYNSHTWVMNDAAMETLNEDSGSSWCGYWTGTRPVEWVYGNIAGTERAFHVSVDEDGVNRLWESFRPERLDNGCPITWTIETRGYFGPTSPVQKLPGADVRFAYADLRLTGIEEDVDVGVFYAGASRGAFKQIMAKRVSVMRGSLTGEEIDMSTELFNLKPQSRKLRTEDARGQNVSVESGSCPVELDKLEDQDESFQLLIVLQGPATLTSIRVSGTPEQEDLSGDPEAFTDETGANAVRMDGSGAASSSEVESLAEVAGRPLQHFTATEVVSLQFGTYSATATATASSVISQRSASRVARQVALRYAEAELTAQVPKVLSVGE